MLTKSCARDAIYSSCRYCRCGDREAGKPSFSSWMRVAVPAKIEITAGGECCPDFANCADESRMGERTFQAVCGCLCCCSTFRRDRHALASEHRSGWTVTGVCPLIELDGGETADAAAARELLEETGIKISPQRLSLGHVQHNKTHGDEWIGLYFVADDPGQEPRLAEPEKHGGRALAIGRVTSERHDPARSTSARFNPAGRGLLHLLRLELPEPR